MDDFLYTGSKTNQISFPLGGLGTGCIGLAGNGRLIDWEIFNKPNKGSVNGFSHFAIKAEAGDNVLDARVLNGDLPPPYTGEFNTPMFQSFGWGPRREYLTGLPHFQSVDFRGEFPLAELTFNEESFPGKVLMRAFNPFIPLNDKDSGIPAAFFEFEVTNSTSETITYTLAGVLSNPLPQNNLNSVHHVAGKHLLHLHSDSPDPGDVNYGDLTLATDAAETSWQQYWFRGNWFDSLEVYWREFSAPGRFKNRVFTPEQAGDRNEGILAAHLQIEPGQTQKVRFVISWNFPNCENYWTEPAACNCAPGETCPSTWKNYYTTLWPDSQASATYALDNWDRLYTGTHLFKETLFASDLPAAALDAISANLSILKTPTVLRLEDGTFYGWEGCHPAAGCCEGSCTHVWNYAQALPFLFPQLERSMREADYRYNLRPDGGMPFRLQLPLGSEKSAFRPCVDGQMGGVMKVYRDWKICGDTQWLKSLWPAVKQSIEFAWHPDNDDQWDPNQTGVLWGRQHHTLDMELFGPNSWLSGFYLGALKAGAEMAEHLGEHETAVKYRTLFEKGKAWVDEHLFNGEYYHQQVDLSDKKSLQKFDQVDDTGYVKGNCTHLYWNDEHSEIKYQIGDGCGIDQILAQWHANLYGLGEIFDPGQEQTTLKSLFKYNFKISSRDDYNPCRIYTINDEGGLTICVWPQSAYKPMIPIPYSQETMSGFEYAAAVHMIQAGLIQEGMTVVEAIRDRYDGEKRNPWNEIECGSNYARSMASYALLNAFAGFEFDMGQGMIGFNPLQPKDGRFRCFWSLDSGWGEFALSPGQAELRLLDGQVWLNRLNLPFIEKRPLHSILLNSQSLSFEQEEGRIRLQSRTLIQKGQVLKVFWEQTA